MMKTLARFAASVLLLGPGLPASAAVTATLDRDRIAVGDTVQLTLAHDGRTRAKPDLAPLERDFEVLSSSTGTSMRLINGDFSAQVQMQLTLSPRRAGRIAIPSLQWDGEASPALTLEVGDADGSPAASADPATNEPKIFLSHTVNNEHPYVQSAVVLTLRVFINEVLAKASLDFTATDSDVLMQQLGEDRQTREIRNGRGYDVVERKYLLTPQRSGEITLTGPVLDAQVSDSRGLDSVFGRAFGGSVLGATRPLRVRSEPIVLKVRPRPAQANGRHWLPAQSVTLTESWQPDGAQVRVGEPLTRTLSLSALGVSAAQLPDLAALMPVPDGVKAYPDQAKLDTKLESDPAGDRVQGARTQNLALIASRAGRIDLPELRLSWWDTTADVQRVAVLPARGLDVLPALPASGAPTAADTASSAPAASVRTQPLEGSLPVGGAAHEPATETPWRWISLALGLLWIVTLAAWWQRGRGPRNAAKPGAADERADDPPSAASALEQFRRACRANDAAAARRHVLDWARAAFPDPPPAGLNALATRLGDAELGSLLLALDRACYAGGDWQGAALAARKFSFQAAPAQKPSALAGLYR